MYAVTTRRISYAARRTRLGILGPAQHLNPTLQFVVAVALFYEPFPIWRAVAFPMIWLALALYSGESLRLDFLGRGSAAGAVKPGR